MKLKKQNAYFLIVCVFLFWLGIHLFSPATATNNQEQIIHVISRLSFGITPQQIDTITNQNLENYLQGQLNPDLIVESPQLKIQLAKFDTIDRRSIDLYKTFQTYDRQLQGKNAANLAPEEQAKIKRKRSQHRRKTIEQAKQARLVRAMTSSRQLQEVMTNFWLDRFNVFGFKKIVPFWLTDYENDIRNHALGSFRDLLFVTAHHPAMLVYLDNNLNTDPNSVRKFGNSKGLNENYARELMELHTLGVDGGYTQDDVANLARIFTGWGVDLTGTKGDENSFLFFERRHDYTDKVFLGQKIEGRGIAEGEQALDMLANHPATAHFISYKLAQYFVSDNPPETLVDSLTKTFIDSQGNIKTVLNTLFHSSEFNDPQYYKVKFKTPLQYMVSVVRASGIENPDLQQMESMLAQLAMPLFGCETPNGYKNTEEAWLNPDAMLRRASNAVHIAHGLLTKRKPIEFNVLQSSVVRNFTPQTKKAIAEAHPNLKSALVLGSPEMMYR